MINALIITGATEHVQRRCRLFGTDYLDESVQMLVIVSSYLHKKRNQKPHFHRGGVTSYAPAKSLTASESRASFRKCTDSASTNRAGQARRTPAYARHSTCRAHHHNCPHRSAG